MQQRLIFNKKKKDPKKIFRGGGRRGRLLFFCVCVRICCHWCRWVCRYCCCCCDCLLQIFFSRPDPCAFAAKGISSSIAGKCATLLLLFCAWCFSPWQSKVWRFVSSMLFCNAMNAPLGETAPSTWADCCVWWTHIKWREVSAAFLLLLNESLLMFFLTWFFSQELHHRHGFSLSAVFHFLLLVVFRFCFSLSLLLRFSRCLF